MQKQILLSYSIKPKDRAFKLFAKQLPKQVKGYLSPYSVKSAIQRIILIMVFSLSIRTFSFTLLFFIVAAHSYAQTELLGDALSDYASASARIITYDTIAIEWKMKGKIQAELNEGLNNLFENNPALAETNFSQVIQEDLTLWQAYYYRGICRKQLKKYREAPENFRIVRYGFRSREACLEMIAKEKPEAALPHLNLVLRRSL